MSSINANSSIGLQYTSDASGVLQLQANGVVLLSGNSSSNGVSFPNGVNLPSSQAILNPVITNYVETNYVANTGSAITINLANGTVQNLTCNTNTTITLPASAAGKSFTLFINYAGAYTVAWAGGSTLKWAYGVTPTATSVSGKYDIFNFYQDGTNTYGSIFGQSF
mgnify:CR=1 FL=1